MTQVDSLDIMNGRLKYAERYMIGSAPAEVMFDSIQMLAEGITNHADPGATTVIHAQANFMKTSTMKILMVIPVASPETSFQYSGSLDQMDVTDSIPSLKLAKACVSNPVSFKMQHLMSM